jgi:hypothetical protein
MPQKGFINHTTDAAAYEELFPKVFSTVRINTHFFPSYFKTMP